MAFSVPTLSDVSRIVENGFSSAFYGKSGFLRVGVLKVFSKVVAGAAYLPILFCQYIWRNSFIDTADAENLVRFGAWYNLPHKVEMNARGSVKIYLKTSTTIPAGTILVDPVTGEEYETLNQRVYDKGSKLQSWDFNVVAVDAGSKGNKEEGTDLVFRDLDFDYCEIENDAISGGYSVDVTIDGVVEKWGEDVETYRKRLKFRRQNPPMGGSDSDYKQWCESFQYVSDAFVFGNYPSTNSVSVFVVNFNSSNHKLNGDQVDEIKNYITSDNRKPITANVMVASLLPITLEFDVKIAVVNDNNKNKILDLLNAYFRKFAPGDTISTDGIMTEIVASGIVDECSVSGLKAKGISKSDGKYTLAKDGNASNRTLSGECVNLTKLPEKITFSPIS